MKKLFWLLVAASTAIIASGVYLMTQKAADEGTYYEEIANPWVKVSGKELLEKCPKAFTVPEQYNPLYMYNQTIELAETRFTDPQTGIEWNVRVQKTDKAEDISGMYFSWEKDNNGFAEQVEVDGVVFNQLSCQSDGENIYVAYGYKDGYTICYSCSCHGDNITIPVIK